LDDEDFIILHSLEGANETSGRRRGSVECLARATDEEIQSLTDEETFAQLGLTIGRVVR